MYFWMLIFCLLALKFVLYNKRSAYLLIDFLTYRYWY